MDPRTVTSLVFASTQPAKRSVLRQTAEIVDRILQKTVLFVFYYVPVSVALLNPFLRRSDLRQTHVGSSRFARGRYAIYVLWQPAGTIPWYVLNLLKELKEQEVNTIAVVNHVLSTEQLGILQGLCAEVLVRGNKGSDFGAYKDAILHLTRANKGVSRLLLLNDSVYVFPRGLKKLIAELLADDYPVAAAYECWERLYHFQSFCIGLSGSVVYDHRIPRFLATSIDHFRFENGVSIKARSHCQQRCGKRLRVSRWFTASTTLSTGSRPAMTGLPS